MGRGLSQQQNDILDALPWLTDGMDCKEAPTRTELVDLIGLDFTPSNRLSVTRAVSRLYARSLILHVWGFGWRQTANNFLQGQRTGYARATPEQVEAFKLRKAAFLARRPDPAQTPQNRP